MVTRSRSWLALGGFVLACGGSAFTAADPNGGDGGGGSATSEAGVLNRAGAGGSLLHGGGKPPGGGDTAVAGDTASGGSGTTGGANGTAGDLGIAGDLVSGGTPPAGGSAGTGPVEPVPDTSCPEKRPPKDYPCQGTLSCTYGTDVRTQCRDRATCHDGAWQLETPSCKELATCGTLVKPGVVCEAQAAPCEKDGYQYCTCTACDGDVCGTKSTWHCSGPAVVMGCPNLAPNEGQSCDAALTCSYGSCGLGSGQPQAIQATCQATWSWEPNVCAQ
jgi:hypothetical protein